MCDKWYIYIEIRRRNSMKNIFLTIVLLFLFFSCDNTNSQYYLEGKQFYEEGDFSKAIQLFSKEIDINGGTDLAYLYRGKAEQKSEQFRKAINDFNKAIEMNQELPSAYIDRAVSQIRLKDYDNALDGLNKMINHFKVSKDSIINKNIAIAYNNRGIVNQFSQKDNGSALKDFNKSLSIGGNYPESYLALMNRGRIYLLEKEYDNAIKDLDSSITLNKSNSLAYSIRSQINFETGNLEGALSDLNLAININAKDWHNYNQRGLILIKLGKYIESISDFDRAIEISDHSYSYNNRGFSKFKLGKLNEAIKDCKKSLELDDQNGWAYYNLGLIKYEMGLKEEACSHFIRAKDLGKDDAIIEIQKKCQ